MTVTVVTAVRAAQDDLREAGQRVRRRRERHLRAARRRDLTQHPLLRSQHRGRVGHRRPGGDEDEERTGGRAHLKPRREEAGRCRVLPPYCPLLLADQVRSGSAGATVLRYLLGDIDGRVKSDY